MGTHDAASLADFGLILLFSFSLALVIVGIILAKTRLWDKNRPQSRRKRRAGPFPNAPVHKPKSSPSARAGQLMIICGAILGFLSLLFFIASLTGIA